MKVLLVTKYLNYTEISNTSKTSIIGVGNNKGEKLGMIKWASGWRRYCFFPLVDGQYDAICLTDITNFINKLMADRKEK